MECAVKVSSEVREPQADWARMAAALSPDPLLGIRRSYEARLNRIVCQLEFIRELLAGQGPQGFGKANGEWPDIKVLKRKFLKYLREFPDFEAHTMEVCPGAARDKSELSVERERLSDIAREINVFGGQGHGRSSRYLLILLEEAHCCLGNSEEHPYRMLLQADDDARITSFLWDDSGQ